MDKAKIVKIVSCDYCNKKAMVYYFNKKIDKAMCDKCYQKVGQNLIN